MTQLPYAFIAAFTALVGFFVIGLTHSTWIALAATIILLIGIVWVTHVLFVQKKKKAS